MSHRIGIIGTGWVGSSVAISVLHSGLASELLLHDLKGDVAEGEAMDLAQGGSFYPTATVRTATIEAMKDTDAIVITAGRSGTPEQTRLDLLKVNAGIVSGFGQQLAGYRGAIVVVTNPVDVLTLVFQESSGLPPERVLGTGTMLDTARLKQVLGAELNIDSHSVHGMVLGEHGDSEVVHWSGVRIGGRPIAHWPGWTTEKQSRIAETVRRAAYEIIKRKGCTNHAIGLVTADLLKCLLRNERRVLTVSRVQVAPSPYAGVALSLPSIVGSGGAVEVIEPEMNEEERKALHHSADVLRAARLALNPH